MRLKIDIDTRTFVRFWLVVIGFLLVGLMIYSAREALILVGVAAFLTVALNEPVARLAKLLPDKSRFGGTALAFVTLVTLLGLMVWFVVPPLVQQSAKFAETIPAMVDQVNNQWVGLQNFVDQNNLRPQLDSATESIKAQATSWAGKVGSNLLDKVGSVASFVVSTILVIVMSFLMLIEGPTWLKRIWSLYRDKEKMEHHRRLAKKVYGVVTSYVTGQITISAIGALMAGLCVVVLSFFFPEVAMNLAMPTILIVFVLTLIPMFGATIAGALVTLMLLMNSVVAAIIYLVYFIVYQQIENNFITTIIQSKKVELSALAVLVSVTIGVYVAGILGGVIAIPIAGTVKVFMEDYLERAEESRAKSDRPLHKIAKKIRQEVDS